MVTGLSGAGRSTAAAVLEDLDWFVIDNLPAALVPKVAELAGSKGGRYDRVALVMSGYDSEMEQEVAQLADQIDRVRVVFLDAAPEVLVRRYDSTKRRHPMTDVSLASAIATEIEQMAPAKAMADLVIDTSDLNPHQLRERLAGEFSSVEPGDDMRITVSSFGFKHGIPLDVDMVIDCRFLPNPYWEETLRPYSGQDAVIKEYVLDRDPTQRFLTKLLDLLNELLPSYADEGRSYLSVAFGCTGGRHRSVAVSEHVAAALKEGGWMPRVNHRDINR